METAPEDHDWIVKRYDIRRSQPTTIFMGSSRIKQSIDPKIGRRDTGSLQLITAGSMAVQISWRPNHIFSTISRQTRICIMCSSRRSRLRCSYHRDRGATARDHVWTTGRQARRTGRWSNSDLANNIADFASTFFSMGGLSSAIRTVSMNLGQRNLPNAGSSEDGFAPIALAPHHFSVRNVFNFVLHTGFMERGGALFSATLAAAREMIAECELHQGRLQVLPEPTARGRIAGHVPFGPVAGSGEIEARACRACTDLRFYALQPSDRRAQRAGRVLAGGVSLFRGIR